MYNTKLAYLIVKKFDINGKNIWENDYQLPENSSNQFAAHVRISYYLSGSKKTQKSMCDTDLNIMTMSLITRMEN